jgi:hypothetical protein
MKGNMYSSSFVYVTQSLDLIQSKEIVNLANNNLNLEATNKTLMDYYASREENPMLIPILNTIKSFVHFVQTYKVFKGNLILRPDSEKTIIVTWPKVKYCPNINETHEHYCFYQMIKYSNWTNKTLNELRKKSTAIDRFNAFYTNEASQEIKESIKYLQIH